MSTASIRILASALCLLASSAALADDPLPRAKPEEVGLSSERLARIGETLKADIDAGRIPGAVIAIARRGKLVALDAYGWRDKQAGVAMTTDTIFNIASMTKPMTAVGALDAVRAGQAQLGPNIKNLAGYADPTRADYGFGLGLAVRTTPGVVKMMGSVGQFSWPGAHGTYWWADPKEELAVVYLSAAPGPIRWHYRQKINALVYQAIME
jgi:CubicO group peptidase (beta-lactamase class C family)